MYKCISIYVLYRKLGSLMTMIQRQPVLNGFWFRAACTLKGVGCLLCKGLAAERGQVGMPGVRSCQEKHQDLPFSSQILPLALPAHTWVFWARRMPQTLPRAATAFSLLDHATGSSFYTWLSMLQTATPDLLEPSYPSVCSQQHLVQHLLSSGQDSTSFFPQQEEINKSDSHSRQKISKAFVIRVSRLINFIPFFFSLSNPCWQSPCFKHTTIGTVVSILRCTV